MDNHAQQPSAPFLEGTRVVEMTTALAGPYATTILADLGAEVIKVESPAGDPMRHRRAGSAGRSDASLPFSMIHRNKASLAVDLKSEAGQQALRRVLDTADVVVENFRPGVVARLGLDYLSVAETNPEVVYCSISGFGQTGPLAPLGSVDLISQGFGGLMSVTGYSAQQPAKAGYPVSDVGSGMWGAIGILAALGRRARGGHGAYIDVSLAECIASWSLWEAADYQTSGQAPRPLGTAHRLTAPYQAFRCGDGRWVTAAAIGGRWHGFCELLGANQLPTDPRFGSEASRFAHREELAEALQPYFERYDRDTWITRLREAKIPCGPINTIPEVLADAHLESRDLFATIDLGGAPATLIRTPIVADGAPREVRQPPRVGEDTRVLLEEVGYRHGEIEALVTAGTLTCGEGPADE